VRIVPWQASPASCLTRQADSTHFFSIHMKLFSALRGFIPRPTHNRPATLRQASRPFPERGSGRREDLARLPFFCSTVLLGARFRASPPPTSTVAFAFHRSISSNPFVPRFGALVTRALPGCSPLRQVSLLRPWCRLPHLFNWSLPLREPTAGAFIGGVASIDEIWHTLKWRSFWNDFS
jgi:hypothetical protein